MGKHIAGVNNSVFWTLFNFNPVYNIKIHLFILASIRIGSIILSFLSINGHNNKIDSLILEAESEQIHALEEMESLPSKDKRSAWHIVGIIIALAITIAAILSLYNSRDEDLSSIMEQKTIGDMENEGVYQVKSDSAWIYKLPGEANRSKHYFYKESILQSIKERNGYIYISDNDSVAVLVYGWLKLSDVEELSGCLH